MTATPDGLRDAGVTRREAEVFWLAGDRLGNREIGPLLRSAVRARPRRLIVDNCEHVAADTAVLVAGLLAAAGELRVLATGHGPLGVAGEGVYEIPPLPSGTADDAAEAVLAAPAVRLFLDRATAAAPGFTGTPADAVRIARICRGLDGLPLAIELAAARIRAFTPAELLDRLDDRFALLTGGARPGRHRTLEEAVRWSHDLLDADERLLLERCSVFPHEFDYDTAIEVLARPPRCEPNWARRRSPRPRRTENARQFPGSWRSVMIDGPSSRAQRAYISSEKGAAWALSSSSGPGSPVPRPPGSWPGAATR